MVPLPRRVVSYFLISFLCVGFYLIVAYLQNGEFGFPLDDAWIHQVYARNLGTRFEFAFFAGQPSAGSTSPLWALWLGLGYFLRLDFRVWALASGIVLLGASGWMAQRVAHCLTGDVRVANWAVPFLIILEWHMVWAAASGMEILLFVLLALALVEAFFARRNAFLGGLLAGLLTLTRPEGIVLVGLVGLGILLRSSQTTTGFVPLGDTAAANSSHSRVSLNLAGVKPFVAFASTTILVLVPYLLFNLQASGTLLPNTFYAKASEYAELTAQTNFFVRWLSMYRQPFLGAQLLLLPGSVFAVVDLAGQRDWTRLLPALWILLLPALYAWRLPVEYQFGRYMMPVIPFVILYGAAGTVTLFRQANTQPKPLLRLVRRTLTVTIGVLLVIFLVLGAKSYAQSVAVINCEMVTAAKWTATHVPEGLLAAHDIGAQEYFDERPMLDLAGLVSPEVIPFIRKETQLKEWMIARGAKYAVFFPTWYPTLARDPHLHEIFSTDCALTRELGEENLRVYSLQ